MIFHQVVTRIFHFARPYSDAYWRQRALQPGAVAVMWLNPHYNLLSDLDQWRIIEKHLPSTRGRVLDIGCGVGRMATRLSSCFDRYTGFDIDAMVARARALHPQLADSFIEGTVISFDYPKEAYDLVLSLACISSACSANDVPALLKRITASLAPGGRFLMIEPLHRSLLLARSCRLSALHTIEIARTCGLVQVEYEGIQCWPFRMVLARPYLAFSPTATSVGYRLGELVRSFAPRALADYKVLVFQRAVDSTPCGRLPEPSATGAAAQI